MEPDRLLLVIGDPIRDVYVEEKELQKPGSTKLELVTEKIIYSPGGSLNVFSNAREASSLTGTLVLNAPEFPLGNKLTDHIKNFEELSKATYSDIYTIFRSSHIGRDIVLSPYQGKEDFYKSIRINAKQTVDLKTVRIPKRNLVNMPKALVLADYNKGILNRTFYKDYFSSYFDFCIVDSKYRSINTHLFNDCKVKIWHATGDEYCPLFAQNFDWVINTDGPNPVRLLKDNVLVKTFLVPRTEIINTCGAGDTFTATFASMLLRIKEINLQTISKSIEYAIDSCQEVIQSKYTATVKTKIR